MRRRALLLIVVAGLSFSSCASLGAQEATDQKAAETDENSDTMKWKLINTGLFVLLLGYGVMKLAPKFFQARSSDIQKAIKDATGLKIEADFRYSEIDKRMANLPDEVARMKAEAAAEMEREHQRLQQETAQEVEHMGRNTDYEIESLRAEGALQVKQHTTRLALALAERRLQSRFNQNDGLAGVGEFVRLVGEGKSS